MTTKRFRSEDDADLDGLYQDLATVLEALGLDRTETLPENQGVIRVAPA